MSDEEQKTPSKAASSGGAWSEQEKIAYLMVLCEHAADTEKFESKTNTTPKKRKNKTVEGEDDPAEGSPKKKATPRPRKKKNEAVEVKDEEMI
ncbi:unnamed protein product [Alternaria alternata]